ncbi:hypothetical protein, partial [Clostridioides difficile]|uniref:hypothetical protein n=1 Tax=Clostridioides difficile TaxID=1496 RepID=UPI0020B29E5E
MSFSNLGPAHDVRYPIAVTFELPDISSKFHPYFPHEMEGTTLRNKGRSSLPSAYKSSVAYNPMNLGLTTPAKNQ